MNSNSSIHSQLISKTVNKSNIQFIWQWINLFSNQPWPWITIHEWDPCLTLTFCQTTSTSNTSFLISFIAIMQLVPQIKPKMREVPDKNPQTHIKRRNANFFLLFLCVTLLGWDGEEEFCFEVTTLEEQDSLDRFVSSLRKKKIWVEGQKNSERPIVIPSAKQKRKKYPEIESLWEVGYIV